MGDATARLLPSVEEVRFARGGEQLRGLLALPTRSGPRPGLVLVPDVRGLYGHYRDLAARFAAEGFAALAVDLYSREGTPTLPDIESVFRWMAGLPDRRVLADLQAARDYLAARDDVSTNAVGVTGFCMGGQYALMAACSLDGIAACVAWYGMLRYTETNALKPESPLDMAARISCPFLGLYGEEDSLIPLADVQALRARLAASNRDAEVRTYPGAGHAFFNDSRPDMYRPDAAADAWPRAIAFLRRHLGGD